MESIFKGIFIVYKRHTYSTVHTVHTLDTTVMFCSILYLGIAMLLLDILL